MAFELKVSIVVPVYNVEKYLRDCLDSLVNQTLKDIEIICVNDLSTDNSAEILHEYERNYPKLITVVTHKENKKGGHVTAGDELHEANSLHLWMAMTKSIPQCMKNYTIKQ